MAKTVKEHFEECKQIDQIVDQANALLTKVRIELATARDVLEGLKKYQHPEMRMRVPYQLSSSSDIKEAMPVSVIDIEIKRINELLGDRA